MHFYFTLERGIYTVFFPPIDTHFQERIEAMTEKKRDDDDKYVPHNPHEQ